MRLAVAIDGPAGAGKSTIAKLLANKFNLMYINTGAMYRAVTREALNKKISYESIGDLCDIVDNLEMHFQGERLIVNNIDVSDEITMPVISNNVSNYAAIPEIREKLVDSMRKMSKKFDVVMDGRDIGTVVLKDAQFKFYLTAAPEERAKRRYKELIDKSIEVDYENILADIIKRDYIDSNREVNPLRKADDAIEIDSSYLTIEEVVEKMAEYIQEYLKEEKCKEVN